MCFSISNPDKPSPWRRWFRFDNQGPVGQHPEDLWRKDDAQKDVGYRDPDWGGAGGVGRVGSNLRTLGPRARMVGPNISRNVSGVGGASEDDGGGGGPPPGGGTDNVKAGIPTAAAEREDNGDGVWNGKIRNQQLVEMRNRDECWKMGGSR